MSVEGEMKFEKPRIMTESTRKIFESKGSVSCGLCGHDLPVGKIFFYVYCNGGEGPCHHGNFKTCECCSFQPKALKLHRRRQLELLVQQLSLMGLESEGYALNRMGLKPTKIKPMIDEIAKMID